MTSHSHNACRASQRASKAQPRARLSWYDEVDYVPDWTYHPFFKPLLFCLSPENGRRLTLRLLAIQGRTALGRAVFRLFGHVHPPADVAVEAFGLRFPSPVGLGAGIDTHGVALSVMQYLGFGFLEVGPATADGCPHRYDTEPRRLRRERAILASDAAHAPAAGDLARAVRDAPALAVPAGIALRGDDLERAVRDAGEHADFVTLPPESVGQLARLREVTDKPLLLKIAADEPDVAAMVRAAEAAKLDGLVVAEGARSELIPEGRLYGPPLAGRGVALVRQVSALTELPIVASASAASPDDAIALLDAGATLVTLYDGLVYAGPGLPGRIVRALGKESEHEPAFEPGPARVPTWSWAMLCFVGAVLVFSGLFALYLAATDHMLPPDVAFLGMTADELCVHHDCRIVRFMVHDRVSFGGSILTVGILYAWIGWAPLRHGEAWSWWTLFVSGIVGFGSFLTYLGYGYLDRWHAIATLLLLPWQVAAMIGSFRGCAAPRGLRSLRESVVRAWLYSPGGLGRALIAFSAFGMIAGGLTIMGVGMTQVFVPQDLDYMGLTVAELDAINPRLVPLIAHDRAGFGGGLASGGLAVMACLFYGARPTGRAAWLALLASGLVGFSTAIGIHFIVGYTDFVHLLPAYVGALTFLIGIGLLYAPVWRADGDTRRFLDF